MFLVLCVVDFSGTIQQSSARIAHSAMFGAIMLLGLSKYHIRRCVWSICLVQIPFFFTICNTYINRVQVDFVYTELLCMHVITCTMQTYALKHVQKYYVQV